VQGIWRRTTLASYKTAAPDWHTVIDVDAIPPPAEGVTWVWHGQSLLDEGPDGAWDRTLVHLSPGGSDAATMREFDLPTQVSENTHDSVHVTGAPYDLPGVSIR
jgi:prolyl oligopeptidase